MPRRAKVITDRALEAAARRAQATGKKKMIAVGGDGAEGLHLRVHGASRAWIYRYLAGRTEKGRPWRRDLGLGSYPAVELSEAREKVRAFRKLQREGIDPLDHQRAQAPRVRPTGTITFDEAARHLIAAKRPGWKNAKHADQWANTLATYASPTIGRMPVDQIEVAHVQQVLAPIWTTKTETASRVRMRIEAVLDWATVAKHRTGDNPARWGGRLEHLLASPAKIKKGRAHPALPYTEMHRFMTALRRDGGSALALEFAILTAVRSSEVRGATWDEIDLEAATWTIPAKRIKAAREHVVPLSKAAIALLRGLPKLRTTSLVFPAPDGRAFDGDTLGNCVKRLHAADLRSGGPGYIDPKQGGRRVVPHGFRSTFRTWAEDCAHYPPNVTEMALAHSLKDKTEAAYNRADMRAKRARLMQDWANFIDTPPATGNVVNLNRSKQA